MKYKVLLVDDEQIYLQYLQSMIEWEALGCRICGCAKNGQEAIRLVEEEAPDIVFMDINMSQMNGLEACEVLRERNSSARVIIMTAYNEFSFAHRAIKLNVFDYLLKPFDEEELTKALQNCMQEIEKERMREREQRENFFKSILDSDMSGEEWSLMELRMKSHRYVAVLFGKKKEVT